MLIRVRFSRAGLLVLLATLHAPAQLRAQTPAVTSPQSAAGSVSQIVPPRALSTPLVYPEGQSVVSTVVLELTVDLAGEVVDARVLSGDAPFRDAALAAALGWRFAPAMRDGRAVARASATRSSSRLPSRSMSPSSNPSRHREPPPRSRARSRPRR
jgi:TonB family protein